MKADSRYFENHDCEYYPCHKGLEECNCMFCYCPLYTFENCPGNYRYKVREDGSKVKTCIDCTFPHIIDNYDKIMAILRNRG